MNLQPEPRCRQSAATFNSRQLHQQYLEVCPDVYQQPDQYMDEAVGYHHHHHHHHQHHDSSFGPHMQQLPTAYVTNRDHANLSQEPNWATMKIDAPASASAPASSSNSLLSPLQEQDTSGMVQPLEAAGGQTLPNLEATHQHSTPPEKIIQRVKANKKERRRTQSINQAFSELRRHIPDVPSDTKLSKIKTLRLAISYISHLMSTLDEDQEESSKMVQDLEPGVSINMHQHQLQQRTAPVVGITISSDNNSNKARCERSCNKDRKHRTGWPEIVWKSTNNLKTRMELGPRQCLSYHNVRLVLA